MEIIRKNTNRGFTKLNVWNDAIELFKMIYEMTDTVTYNLSKPRNNILDAAHSISRNIAEGTAHECKYYLILANDLGYYNSTEAKELLEEVSKLLGSYSKKIKES
ncbi:MAG: four helix bundle protein [Bacteroidota bacterium]